jgi:hypothetical protein
MSPPDDLDRLSHAELKGLVVKQWEQIVELQRMVAALRDERRPTLASAVRAAKRASADPSLPHQKEIVVVEAPGLYFRRTSRRISRRKSRRQR